MIKRKKKFWVGFDLGGTKMMATVYDGGFKPLASAKAKTPVNAGPKAVQERIRETIAEAKNPVFLYSIGKDSSVMLHLALKAFYPAPPPFPFLKGRRNNPSAQTEVA